MRERLTGKQVESYTLSSKKWGALMKHSGRWLLFEKQLFVRKHVTLWQKVRWALLVSIPLALLTSSEVLKRARRADMPPDCFEISQLVPVRSPTSRCSDCKKGLLGPSHVSLAQNSKLRCNSLLKNPMSMNIKGGDFPCRTKLAWPE